MLLLDRNLDLAQGETVVSMVYLLCTNQAHKCLPPRAFRHSGVGWLIVLESTRNHEESKQKAKKRYKNEMLRLDPFFVHFAFSNKVYERDGIMLQGLRPIESNNTGSSLVVERSQRDAFGPEKRKAKSERVLQFG